MLSLPIPSGITEGSRQSSPYPISLSQWLRKNIHPYILGRDQTGRAPFWLLCGKHPARSPSSTGRIQPRSLSVTTTPLAGRLRSCTLALSNNGVRPGRRAVISLAMSRPSDPASMATKRGLPTDLRDPLRSLPGKSRRKLRCIQSVGHAVNIIHLGETCQRQDFTF